MSYPQDSPQLNERWPLKAVNFNIRDSLFDIPNSVFPKNKKPLLERKGLSFCDCTYLSKEFLPLQELAPFPTGVGEVVKASSGLSLGLS
jgi:hypothetical protein